MFASSASNIADRSLHGNRVVQSGGDGEVSGLAPPAGTERRLFDGQNCPAAAVAVENHIAQSRGIGQLGHRQMPDQVVGQLPASAGPCLRTSPC